MILAVWLLVGLRIGWRSGLIRPLVTELGLLAGVYLVHARPDLLAGLFQPGMPRLIGSGLFLVLVGAVAGMAAGRLAAFAAHRLPLINSIDRFAGVVVHTLLTLVLAYVLLLGLITLDGLVAPLHNQATYTASELSAVQTNLSTDPLASALAGAAGLGQLEQAATGGAQVSITTLKDYDQALAFYEAYVHPQLVGSHLIVPYVLRFGARLPFIGRQVSLPTS